jgi:hypothetical protein
MKYYDVSETEEVKFPMVDRAGFKGETLETLDS